MTQLKFGQICSICKNIDFACKSCYLKEDEETPIHFKLEILSDDLEKYYKVKNNIKKPENIDINLDLENIDN